MRGWTLTDRAEAWCSMIVSSRSRSCRTFPFDSRILCLPALAARLIRGGIPGPLYAKKRKCRPHGGVKEEMGVDGRKRQKRRR